VFSIRRVEGSPCGLARELWGSNEDGLVCSLPVQRKAAVVEPDRLQPGEPVAPIGAAEGNRGLAADELAAAVGEYRWATGEAQRYHWLLLAEGPLTQRLFGNMVRRIAALPVATGLESFLEERTGQKMTVQEGASEKCGGPMCGCEHFGPRGGKGTLSYRRGCGAIRGFQI
jgi:hypothetical protein